MSAQRPALHRLINIRSLVGFLVIAGVKAAALVLFAKGIAVAVSSLAGSASTSSSAWSVSAQLTPVLWALSGAVLLGLVNWLQGIWGRRQARNEQERLRSAIIQASLDARGAHGFGTRLSVTDTAVSATTQLDKLDSFYLQFVPALASTAIVPLVLGLTVLSQDWLCALILVLTVPLIPLFMILIGKYTQENTSRSTSALLRLSQHAAELARGLPALVGLGRARAQQRSLRELADEYRTTTMRSLRVAFLSSLALELVATLSVALLAVVIGIRLINGSLGLEVGLLVLILAPDVYNPLREVGSAYHSSQEGVEALNMARSVIGGPRSPVTASPEATASPELTGATGEGEQELRPEWVRALRDIDAQTAASAPGLNVLSGPSGSGKTSTLTAWIAAHEDLRPLVWVEQAPRFSEPSVGAELKRYGHPEAQYSLEDALSSFDLQAVRGRSPRTLSPGEARRLALARAAVMLRPDSILIVDEPTAHLDASRREAVGDWLKKEQGRRPILVASHDPQLINSADHVIHVGSAGAAVPQFPREHDQYDGGPSDLKASLGARMHPADGRRPALADGVPSGASDAPETKRPVGQAAQAHEHDARDALQTTRVPPAQVGDEVSPTTSLNSAPFIARIWNITAGQRWYLLLAIVLTALAAAAAVSLSALSGWLIVRASQRPPIMFLLVAIVGVRFFGLARAVLRYAERIVSHRAIFGLIGGWRAAIWDYLSQRALSLKDLLTPGASVNALVIRVDELRDALLRALVPAGSVPLLVLGSAVATSRLAPSLFALQFFALIVGILGSFTLEFYAQSRFRILRYGLRAKLLSQTLDLLEQREFLRAHRLLDRALERLRAVDMAARKPEARLAGATGLAQAWVTWCLWGSAAILVLVGAAHAVPVELLLAIVLMQVALAEPVSAAASSAGWWIAVARLSRQVPPVVPQSAEAQREDLPFEKDVNSLGTRDVVAGWGPDLPPVLTGISMQVQRGEWLNLLGPSGSGKTTLLAVLLGFLRPERGSVILNGEPVELRPGELAPKVAWCPQESHIFDSTVRGNLRIASEKPLSDEQLWEALAQAGLDESIHARAGGLDSRTGPGGTFLSGGERQRLAIARALLAGADILCLDEPSAHLDDERAEQIQRHLRQLTLVSPTNPKPLGVIQITHRDSDVLAGEPTVELNSALAVNS